MYYVESRLHFDLTVLKALPLIPTRFSCGAESCSPPARREKMHGEIGIKFSAVDDDMEGERSMVGRCL